MKFLLNSKGIMVMPLTGEIIAFQFGRSDSAFKILQPGRFRSHCRHIRRGLLENFKIPSALKVSLGYFSNVWNEDDTIIDIRELGREWALSIYFVSQQEELIQEYHNYRVNKTRMP